MPPTHSTSSSLDAQATPTDEELLLAAREDPRAFVAFYRRHAEILLGYHARRCGDRELAADLTAETFAAALEGLGRFDARRGPASGWLYGIARHLLARALERRRVELRACRRLGIPRIELDEEDFDRVLDRASTDARGALLNEALGRLGPEQRTAVLSRVVDEHDYEVIARVAGTSETAVRKRVSRALAVLKATLESSK